MGGQIPEAIIREVRRAANIVEIVSEVVALRQTGRNLVGLCPFHSEKTPSFTVNPEKQIFHCFGCGEGGDVFSFLMRQQGLNFPEAIKALARRYGIQLPDDGRGPLPGADERERLRAVNLAARDFFSRLLAHPEEGRRARDYLEGRGFKSQIVSDFQLGWAPAAWDRLLAHLGSKRFPPALMEKAGLIVPRKSGSGYYDRFRERIIFPILDVDGTLVGFGGRVLGDAPPKYLNSPETPLYNKRRCLYGLYQARQACRQAQTVYVVEGYLDLLALQQHGIGNAAATLGTALTAEQIGLLKRFVGAGRIVLVFDGDAAGQKAAERARPIFEQLHQRYTAGSFQQEKGINTVILELPSGQDPDSFLQTHGRQAFLALAERARGIFPFMLDAMLRQHGDTIEGRSRVVGALIQALGIVDDPVTRALYVKLLAERVGVEEAVILKRIGRDRAGPRSRAPERPPERLPPLERQVITMMLQYPRVLAEVDKRGLTSYFVDLRLKAVADALLAHYRRTGEPPDPLTALADPELRRLASRLMVADEAWTEDGCRKLMRHFELAGGRGRDSRVAAVSQAEQEADSQRLEALLREIHRKARQKERSRRKLTQS